MASKKQRKNRPKGIKAPAKTQQHDELAKAVADSLQEPSAKSRDDGWWKWLPAILGILLYANTFTHDYTLDDYTIIVEHAHVSDGIAGLGKIFTTNYRHGMGEFNDGLYRPLSPASFAIEETFYGEGPFWKHVNNSILYALTGLLLFLLGKRMFPKGGNALPLMLALIFIAHPVHTEGVANVKGRDEVLGFLFFVLAAIRFFDHQRHGKMNDLLLGVGFYALSFLSKESSITYLAGIPVLLYFFTDSNLKSLVKPIAALAVATGVLLGWRAFVMGNMQPVDEGIFSLMNNSLFATDSTIERLATAAWMQVMYLGKLVIPHPLAHDYSYNAIPVIGITDPKALAGYAMVIGLLVWAAIGFKKRDPLSAAILFYFITISVAANVFFMNGATFAERFAYTPALAFALALTVLLQRLGKLSGEENLAQLTSKPVVAGLLGVVLVGFSFKTFTRNADWSDNLTLYTADVEKIPGSARGHYNLGSELFQTAQTERDSPQRTAKLERAVVELSAALEILDTYQDAYNNLALSYKLLGKEDSSIVVFNQLLANYPEYSKGWFNLATVYLNEKMYPEGIDAMKKYLNAHPKTNSDAWFLLGEAYGFQKDFDSAIEALKKCVEIQSRHASALSLLGQAYGIKGDGRTALDYFIKSSHADPTNGETWFNIGLTYLINGKIDEAIKNLDKAVQYSPGNQQALLRLSDAWAQKGDMVKAEEYKRLAGG